MARLALAVVACVLAASAAAQDKPRKMTKDELLSFLPGTKVTHIASSGSERHWTNGADGKFFATTNNKLIGSALGTQTAGHEGTWTVNDEGKYCIDIDWSRLHEKWCSSVLKGEGDVYYLGIADDKHKIVFAK